jgi:hypothetical protein
MLTRLPNVIKKSTDSYELSKLVNWLDESLEFRFVRVKGRLVIVSKLCDQEDELHSTQIDLLCPW